MFFPLPFSDVLWLDVTLSLPVTHSSFIFVSAGCIRIVSPPSFFFRAWAEWSTLTHQASHPNEGRLPLRLTANTNTNIIFFPVFFVKNILFLFVLCFFFSMGRMLSTRMEWPLWLHNICLTRFHALFFFFHFLPKPSFASGRAAQGSMSPPPPKLKCGSSIGLDVFLHTVQVKAASESPGDFFFFLYLFLKRERNGPLQRIKLCVQTVVICLFAWHFICFLFILPVLQLEGWFQPTRKLTRMIAQHLPDSNPCLPLFSFIFLQPKPSFASDGAAQGSRFFLS